MISIQVKQLTKQFGEHRPPCTALDLTINPRRVVSSLLGPRRLRQDPTLLRSLAGFYIPEKGQILFGDEDVTRLETAQAEYRHDVPELRAVAAHDGGGECRLRPRGTPRAGGRNQDARWRCTLLGAHGKIRRPQNPNQLFRRPAAAAFALGPRPGHPPRGASCSTSRSPTSTPSLRLEMRTGDPPRSCKEFKLTTVYVTHDPRRRRSPSADRMAILESGPHPAGWHAARGSTSARPRKTVGQFSSARRTFLPGKVLGMVGNYVTVETAVGKFDGIFGDPVNIPKVGDEVTRLHSPGVLGAAPGR